MNRLADCDLSARLTAAEYDKRLAAAQRQLLKLRLASAGLVKNSSLGPGFLIGREGVDAGGKGGAIRRLVEPLDPRHFTVNSYAKPTFDEKRRHFLWRFWRDIPGLGEFAVFDRAGTGECSLNGCRAMPPTSSGHAPTTRSCTLNDLSCLRGLKSSSSGFKSVLRNNFGASTNARKTRCVPGNSPRKTGGIESTPTSTQQQLTTCFKYRSRSCPVDGHLW